MQEKCQGSPWQLLVPEETQSADTVLGGVLAGQNHSLPHCGGHLREELLLGVTSNKTCNTGRNDLGAACFLLSLALFKTVIAPKLSAFEKKKKEKESSSIYFHHPSAFLPDLISTAQSSL